MKKIKGILITPNQKETKPRIYEMEYNSYKDYYQLLECDTFEIPSRFFGDEWLDIYCDGEGLFKEGNKPSIITFDDNGKIIEQIFGSVFIVSDDGEGNTISLTDEQIEKVLSTVQYLLTTNDNGKAEPIAVCIARV